MIGEVSQNYPDSVRELVEHTLSLASECGLLEDLHPPILEKLLCEAGLQKFISGAEMAWSESELMEYVAISEIQSQIDWLIENDYLDSIEDETGEEILFTTEKGRTMINSIKSN